MRLGFYLLLRLQSSNERRQKAVYLLIYHFSIALAYNVWRLGAPQNCAREMPLI